MPGVTIGVLCGGKVVPYKIFRIMSIWSDLELCFMGPQHKGKYTSHYNSWLPECFQSALSNPVEVVVEAPASRAVVGFCLLIFARLCTG